MAERATAASWLRKLWRGARAGCLLAGVLSAVVAAAADGVRPSPRPDVLRLALPYPITGPREIQAADRAMRRYRAVAAYAVPPISDVMADLVANAFSLGGYERPLRERRVSLDAFDARVPRGEVRAARPFHLLLAGDDIVRADDLRRAATNGGAALRLRLVEPIALMPFVLVCAAERCAGAANTARDARWSARLRPRSLGTSGESSASHLAARMLRTRLGLDSLLVPYGGGSGVLSALLGAEADAAFVALPLALGYLGQSKLRALGLASVMRFPLLPALPTLQESGIPEFVVEGWFALFASNRLARETALEMGGLVRQYRLEPATRAELLARGLVPTEATADEFAARIADERQRWTGMTRALR